jgi:hypothetical protein
MGFGKPPLPRAQIERLRDAEQDIYKRGTDRPLLAPPPDTPLGKAALLSATETVLAEGSKECPQCRTSKCDRILVLTGMCLDCWQQQET